MKISADLILQCAQYTNAVKDRELDLRGRKRALVWLKVLEFNTCLPLSIILVFVNVIFGQMNV
jgi:hypothetical protein